MTPNPESPAFIVNEVPQCASESALKISKLYKSVKSLVNRFNGLLRLESFGLIYNTYTGIAQIRVVYVDSNGNKHINTIASVTAKSIGLFYLFEPSFPKDLEIRFYRSFAELLMVKLWAIGINSELNNCDRGLTIDICEDDIVSALRELINITDNNQPTIDWLLSDEPVWNYRPTLSDLESILPRLREEAESNRWRDITPENFIIEKGADHALIVLRYIEPRICQMTFQLGLKSNSFASEAGDKFIECYYDFSILSNDKEIIDYYKAEHKDFIEYANAVLKIPFNYHTMYFQGEDGFEIAMYREYGFQKFCLMLDFMISWKYEYIASTQLITSSMSDKIKHLEKIFETDMTIQENEPRGLFIGGFYQTEENYESDFIDSEDCPF